MKLTISNFLKVLIDNKADVTAIMRNTKGDLMTPLDAALYRGNRGCAKYIQLHGGIPAAKLTDKAALQKALARYTLRFSNFECLMKKMFLISWYIFSTFMGQSEVGNGKGKTMCPFELPSQLRQLIWLKLLMAWQNIRKSETFCLGGTWN